MLEHGVRQDDICQDVTVFDHVYLVQCEMMIDDEYFVDLLWSLFLTIAFHWGVLFVDWNLAIDVNLQFAV